MKKEWWKEAVVYQIYPRSFYDSNGDGIGDLNGVIEKLDYLKFLGVDVIWLCPIYKSPNDDNGYDISDYKNIMDEFGNMDDFDRLLKEAHNRGIKILMDLVVNHTSDEHEWFVKAASSKYNPYRDYYIWREGKNGQYPNNWKSFFGGSAWEYNEKTEDYYLHLFTKKQPDLNWENENMRREIYKMMKFWLDKGVDGFRMDVFNFYSKKEGLPDVVDNPDGIYINGPKIHDYIKEMHEEVFQHYDIMTVGEAPCVSSKMAPLYVGEDRKELNMIFHFELMDISNDPKDKFIKVPWELKDIKDIFMRWYEDLKDKGWNSLFMNNHDQPRMVSRFGNDKEYRVESAKMLATLLHTFVGTPYIYQGEEIGMTNAYFENISDYRDVETLNYYNEKIKEGIDEEIILKRIQITSRDNARTPMQWDNSENAGFTNATPWINVNPNYKYINVKSALEDRNSIFYYYQKLIKLRKENSVIVYGDLNLIYKDDKNIFSYVRKLEDKEILVILNFFDKEVEFEIPQKYKNKKFELLIGNYETDNQVKNKIKLRPYEARVYSL
ncbi:glycoside hydrolase family 13 protein [Tepidibacter thalassicus]|uniref:Oligo-1,6-glucosidase n=1 Tax=Tepidibacter thalassicus DSM 15285 TaxID=1123350 RepID=A0A1M5PCS4_9FIRM|nr:alpha-glucosidase [Tepidibacter thalassicus]SHG99542.1 oligo-1,6-glucosidase [Tepidibacter thalassicus DSM 15285]